MPSSYNLNDRHGGKMLTVASVQNSDTETVPGCDVRQLRDNNAITQQLTPERNTGKSFTFIRSVLSLLMVLAVAPTMVLAGGGNVLPPTAKPSGYSLSDMAKATAFFNTGPRTPDTYPNTPFQILYVPPDNNLAFDVSPGTMFYVPILYLDDTKPVVGTFPKNLNDRQAILNYFYSQDQIGLIYTKIVVDGTVNSLGSGYVVGVGPVKLADNGGFGPGTQYIVSAAFLTPLNEGTHTVQILGYANGAALFPFFPPDGVFSFSVTFTVIVR
jgi:hypothetical protein